jgi:hypothetical protein
MPDPGLWVLLAVALAIVPTTAFIGSLALRRRLRARSMIRPVEGTLVVIGSNPPADGALYATYRLHGVVTAPGVPLTRVEHRGIARTASWPSSRRELPVLVDQADPTRLQILWDRVVPGRQVSAAQAARLAEAARPAGVPYLQP